MYNEYLVPNNLTEDEDFLRNDAIEVFLGAVGVGQVPDQNVPQSLQTIDFVKSIV